MTDVPIPPPATPPESEHAWVHENLAAYFAGGLEPAERARFDAHINACAECFDAFTEARDADRTLQRTLGTLVPGELFESRLVVGIREKSMKRSTHMFVRRAGYATAAAVALAATGVFANYALHQGGRFNNPLTQRLVAQADEAAPELESPIGRIASALRLSREDATATQPGTAKVVDGWKRTTVDPSQTMQFNFVNAPVSKVVDELSNRFGLTVVQPATPVPGFVSIQVPHAVTQDEAVRVLSNVLAPLGYSTVESVIAGSDRKVLRIATLAEVKKSQIPVFEESDPNKIPVTDNMATYVIPLKSVDATRLRSDLTPLLSADADVAVNAGSNSLVVTDTSAKIHRLAEIVSKLDRQPATGLTQEARADRAKALTIDAQKLYEASQFKEASVLLGDAVAMNPEDGNAKLLKRLVEDKITGREYESIVHRSGAETMRLNIDSTEHLIPSVEAEKPVVGGFAQTAVSSAADVKPRSAESSEMAKAAPQLASAGDFARSFYGVGGVGGVLAYGDDGKELDRMKVGSGTLTLSGISNSYTGGTTINGGAPMQGAPGDANKSWLPGSAGSYDTTMVPVANASGNSRDGQQPNGMGVAGTTFSGSISNGSAPLTIKKGMLVDGRLSTEPNGATAREGGDTYKYEIPADASSPATRTTLGSLGFDHSAAPGTATLSGSISSAGSGQAPGLALTDGGTKLLAQSEAFTKKNAPFPTDTPATGAAAKPTSEVDKSNDPNAPAGKFDPTFTVRRTSEAPGEQSPVTSPVAAPPVTPSTPPPTQPSTASAPDVAVRKIIRNGTIEFEVRSFDDTYATVATVVSENSGFVSSTSSDKLANGKVRGSIVVRVPPERLDRFLLQLRSLGDLKSQQIAANDVTKQYTDIASELRGLRTMEGRLLDLIKTGKGEVKDLVEAEKQLGEYRIRIEKLEGEISYYNNLVGMATITITAYEKDIQKPTAAAEQESVILNVETEEVETKYQAARKVIEEAKGRIVESQLKNTDAEHIAATIVADVPPDKADFVAAQLKQLGKVSSYNRDRRQTTTGGPGAPPPGVQVEQKDTRFSIALYNLANLAPRETTVLRVAVRDVQDTYRKTLSAVRKETGAPGAAPAEGGDNAANNAADKAATRAAGRVLSSNLTGQQADQMAATIVAEVRADQADAVLELIRSSGEVLASALATNQDNASSTSAKRGIQLTLVNFSTVAPKEVDTLNIAVPDVDEAYKKLLVLIRTDVPPPAPGQAPANPLLPSTTGRVLASNVNGQQPEQMVADIRAEIRSDQAQRVLDAVRGSGEILNSTSAETPEANNSTLAKRGLQVRLVNVAAIGAREAQALRLVAADVPEAYTRLLSSLQDMQTAGNARVISSQLNQNDARNVTATMTFDAQRKALPSVDKAFKDAGVDFLSRNIVRSTDTSGTLDTKVRFQIDALVSADSLEPRRKTVLAVEVDDPEKAMEIMRSGIAGTPAREVDFNMASDKSGRVTGTIVIEAPVSNIPAILDRAHHLGDEKVNQVVKNQQVPDTRFARERVELTLSSRAPIVSSDKGLGSTIRAALSAAAGALLYSMYLVVTGVLFVLPFALLIWVGMVVFRRRKAAA